MMIGKACVVYDPRQFAGDNSEEALARALERELERAFAQLAQERPDLTFVGEVGDRKVNTDNDGLVTVTASGQFDPTNG